MAPNTATLIHKWTVSSKGSDDKVYRLVGIGKYQKGYDDRIVLEMRATDAMGEDRWAQLAEFSDDDDHDACARALYRILITGLRDALMAKSGL